jgi:hypothetical protein
MGTIARPIIVKWLMKMASNKRRLG